MATRFYISDSLRLNASTFPAVDAGWEQTAAPVYKVRLSTYKINSVSTFLTVPLLESGSAADRDILLVQGFSKPLAAQTLTGTVKAIVRASEANAGDDARAQMVIRIISPDGTIRGTSLAMSTAALSSEFVVSTLTNRKFPLGWAGAGATLTSVSAQAGDFLAIEIGYRSHAVSLATASIEVGTDPSNDLAEDETSTNQYSPWVEFSQTLTFLNDESARPGVRYFGHTVDSPGQEPSFSRFDVQAKTTPVTAPMRQLASEVTLSSPPYIMREAARARILTNPTYTKTGFVDVNKSYRTENRFTKTVVIKPALPLAYESGGSGGSILVRNFINRVFDSIAGKFVSWQSSPEPDTLGAAYPGPGTFGVHTSDFVSDKVE